MTEDKQTHSDLNAGTAPRRLVVGITGASGAILGIRLLELLRSIDVETHLVLSPAARVTIHQETSWKVGDVLELADISYKDQDIGAAIASGSFATMGMVIIPCSIKTLSAVANSYADELVTRAADVTLKEGRPLVLVVRETPLHRGHLRLMDLAAQAGAIIFPPMPAFYSRPQTLEDVVDNIIGRVLRRMGLDNPWYHQWEGVEP
jgi:4-hydroxy-3-polyprenylbenzoate decarboxylase